MKRRVLLLMLIMVLISISGCKRRSNEVEEVEQKQVEVKYNNLDKDKLFNVLSKMASIKYYGDITKDDLKEVMNNEDIEQSISILKSNIGNDYIDITEDVEDYINIYEDREESIKNNPDKTYAEYKSRMSKLIENSGNIEQSVVENKFEEDNINEEEYIDDEDVEIREDMRYDLVLPDGTVIWKGMSAKQAKIADKEDIEKYKEAVKEYNIELEKIINKDSGIESQSYNNKGLKATNMVSYSSKSKVIKCTTDANILSKDEWEESYRHYDKNIDNRITKEGDRYLVYYSSLSDVDIEDGYVTLKIHGFDFDLELDNKFGGSVSKGDTDYLYTVSSYEIMDNGHCKINMISDINEFSIEFNIDDKGIIVDGVILTKGIMVGVNENYEEDEYTNGMDADALLDSIE